MIVIVVIVAVIIVVPAVAVPVVVMVPAVVVLEAAVVAVPVTGEVVLAVVARRYPPCARIRRASPVSGMPPVVMSDGIPVAFHPHKIGPRSRRNDRQHAGRRRRADLDSDGNLRVGYRSSGKQERANE